MLLVFVPISIVTHSSFCVLGNNGLPPITIYVKLTIDLEFRKHGLHH